MWLVGSEAQAQTINKLGEEFCQRYGIRVRCEAISWGEAHSKYLTSVAGEVAPDIGTMGLTWGTEFGSLGAMVDLRKAFPDDITRIQKDTFPGIWAATQREGHVYGIPFDMSLQLMYYRTDVLKKAPRTWDELIEMLDQLSKKGKGMIFDWGSLSWIGLAPYLWQAGGDFYTPDTSHATLDSKEAVEGLRFFSELYTRHGVPRSKIPVEQGMRTGDFPLAISGNWKIEELTFAAPEITGKWGIALLPAGPSGRQTAFIGGRIMGIFEQSKNKEAAWKFITFLFDPATQVRLYQAAQTTQDTYLPPNIATWDMLPIEKHIKETIRLQAMDAKGPPAVLGWDTSTRFIDQAIQRTVLEGADPAEECEKANAELERRIGKRFILD